jgi:hypothetical protein
MTTIRKISSHTMRRVYRPAGDGDRDVDGRHRCGLEDVRERPVREQADDQEHEQTEEKGPAERPR